MISNSPRLAVRAIIVQDARLLMVNAYPPEAKSDLWGAPGGGVECCHSLPENLIREVHEETGLSVTVGPLALVNEFYNPDDGFHQVDLFFRCSISGGRLRTGWTDPENIVTKRRFFTLQELQTIRFKPDSLPRVAFAPEGPVFYDPLERIVR